MFTILNINLNKGERAKPLNQSIEGCEWNFYLVLSVELGEATIIFYRFNPFPRQRGNCVDLTN
jgi:hypothetical protein